MNDEVAGWLQKAEADFQSLINLELTFVTPVYLPLLKMPDKLLRL